MDFKRAYEEIINQMKQHIEKKSCCHSQDEYLDENPTEPGLAYTDGYYTYQSDCPDAKKLNIKMRNLLADMKKKKLQNISQKEITLII